MAGPSALALEVLDYVDACGDEGCHVEEVSEMLELPRALACRLAGALERVALVERIGRALRWRATPAARDRSYVASVRRALGGCLARRPRRRRPAPCRTPRLPSSPPPPAAPRERRPWPLDEGLPPLALERCPLPARLLAIVAEEPRGLNLWGACEQLALPISEAGLVVQALRAEGLLEPGRRPDSDRDPWVRWLSRCPRDPERALLRATLEVELRLALVEEEPDDDADVDCDVDEDAETDRLRWEVRDVPGMAGLCTYDRSLDGRIARARRLAFEGEGSRGPEVGVEWETEGDDDG